MWSSLRRPKGSVSCPSFNTPLATRMRQQQIATSTHFLIEHHAPLKLPEFGGRGFTSFVFCFRFPHGYCCYALIISQNLQRWVKLFSCYCMTITHASTYSLTSSNQTTMRNELCISLLLMQKFKKSYTKVLFGVLLYDLVKASKEIIIQR